MPDRRIKVAVIAGGGVYGVIPCSFLKCVDVSGVDVFGGTSIGGILSLHLAEFGDAGKLYEDFKSNIGSIFERSVMNRFNPFSPKYGAEGIESALQGIFKSTVEHCRGKFVVPALNFKNVSPVVFHNFDSEYWHMDLWKIARATSAAPMYFPPYSENILIDGGILENLPVITTAAMTCKHLGVLPRDLDVFAVGTGMVDQDTSRTNEEVSHYSRLDWAKNLFPILATGGNEMMSELWGGHMGFASFEYFNPVAIDGIMDNVGKIDSIEEKCDLYKGRFVNAWNRFISR